MKRKTVARLIVALCIVAAVAAIWTHGFFCGSFLRGEIPESEPVSVIYCEI